MVCRWYICFDVCPHFYNDRIGRCICCWFDWFFDRFGRWSHHYAIGASIVSVIATSSGSAAAYVKEGITNIRFGMFLEIATTVSAIFGAVLTVFINPGYIAVIFGLILIFSAVMMIRKKIDHADSGSENKLATVFKLNGSCAQCSRWFYHDVFCRNHFGAIGDGLRSIKSAGDG